MSVLSKQIWKIWQAAYLSSTWKRWDSIFFQSFVVYQNLFFSLSLPTFLISPFLIWSFSLSFSSPPSFRKRWDSGLHRFQALCKKTSSLGGDIHHPISLSRHDEDPDKPYSTQWCGSQSAPRTSQKTPLWTLQQSHITTLPLHAVHTDRR